MRIVLSKKPLPKTWMNHPHAKGVVAEADMKLYRHAKLRFKLLVFKTAKDLRRFWRKAMARSVPKANGAVSKLSYTVYEGNNRPHLLLDPRYFCLVGLNLEHLNAEVIAHESVHIAFAHAKRRQRSFDDRALSFDEEDICYPAGIATLLINNFLHKHSLYKTV